MNGYIINPSWFYWIGVVNGLRAVLIVCAVITLVYAAYTAIEYSIDGDPENHTLPEFKATAQKAKDRYNKHFKKCIALSIGLLLIAIFIPSKNTLIEMQVAKFATYENAEWSAETVKSAVEYIVEAIKAVR